MGDVRHFAFAILYLETTGVQVKHKIAAERGFYHSVSIVGSGVRARVLVKASKRTCSWAAAAGQVFGCALLSLCSRIHARSGDFI